MMLFGNTMLLVLTFLLTLFSSHYAIPLRLQKTPSNLSIPSNRYRISPLTGVRIALPSIEQLEWQALDIGVLIHFNMATYLENHDGCTDGIVPPTSLFNPKLLNTDNWVQSILDLGAKYGVLVSKHNCGFYMAPTNVSFPLSPSGQIIPYNYTVEYSPIKGRNVLDEFVKSCAKQQIKPGFYYSVVTNNYLNVGGGIVKNSTLKEGQLNVTQDTYNAIVLQHLRELWTNYGKLEEIWFDGGMIPAIHDELAALVKELQPGAAIFGGNGISESPIRWVGNEFGHAPDPNWSTGPDGGGDPDSPLFMPAECDTTLQQFDRWFWGPHVLLRTLPELIDVYHRSVGHNCMLMLDLTPDRNGLIPTEYARRYKEFGDFIRSCYGKSPEPISTNSTSDGRLWTLTFGSPISVDRSVLQEDQTMGQVIRAYTFEVLLADSPLKNHWLKVASGTSIGNKKIDLWNFGSLLVSAARLNITNAVDKPVIKMISVHLCV